MEASKKIDELITSCADWRSDLLKKLRELINETDPDIKEEWKWNTAVWTHHGLVCALSPFRNHVKLNFFKGAYLADTAGLINAGFDSKEHRAIDFRAGDDIKTHEISNLIKQAVEYNRHKS